MEYKFRADVVFSKELTVEAEDLTVAIEKLKEMMGAPDGYKGLAFSRVDYHMLEPKAK